MGSRFDSTPARADENERTYTVSVFGMQEGLTQAVSLLLYAVIVLQCVFFSRSVRTVGVRPLERISLFGRR